jgi:alkyl hydroperoxide reductase subunit AhpF
MIKLQVYISDECWTCEEAQRIVADVATQFPHITMELLDTATISLPDGVFAVPTYVLNGRVISLGNPTRDELCEKLLAVQQKANA